MGQSTKEIRKSLPQLEKGRLVLRGLTLGDAESLYPAFSNEANMNYWSRGVLASVEELRQYMEWNVHSEGVDCYAITHRSNSKDALGWVVLMDRGRQCAEIGFILRPDAQGQGIAGEATSRILRYGFVDKKYRRIYADVDPDNQASIAMLKTLGFAYEGRLRENYETHIGIRDSLIFSILGKEFHCDTTQD